MDWWRANNAMHRRKDLESYSWNQTQISLSPPSTPVSP